MQLSDNATINHELKPTRNRVMQTLLLILIIAASVGIFYFWLVFSGVNANPLVAFADMLTGTTIRPPVTRVLTPWLTNGLALLFPPNIHAGAEGLLTASGLLPDLLREFRVPNGYVLEGAINMALQFICILGFAFALKALIGAVFKVTADDSGIVDTCRAARTIAYDVFCLHLRSAKPFSVHTGVVLHSNPQEDCFLRGFCTGNIQ